MFQPKDIYSSNNESSQITSSLSFVPPRSQQYNRYSLEINKANAVRLQELFVEKDDTGNIMAASYDSGAQVRHLDGYTIVKSANNSLWMGDRFGSWHPID